jgi:hypothetical protein
VSLSIITPNKSHPSPLDLLGVRRNEENDFVSLVKVSWILKRLGCSVTGTWTELPNLGKEKCLFMLFKFIFRISKDNP